MKIFDLILNILAVICFILSIVYLYYVLLFYFSKEEKNDKK